MNQPYKFYIFFRQHWSELSKGIQEHYNSGTGKPTKRMLARRLRINNRRWLDQSERLLGEHEDRIKAGDWTSVEEQLFGDLGEFHMLPKFREALVALNDPRARPVKGKGQGAKPAKPKPVVQPPHPTKTTKPRPDLASTGFFDDDD